MATALPGSEAGEEATLPFEATWNVLIDLPLTHELISQLAGARRPSVSSALSRLASQGLLERGTSGWVLHGEPPGAAPTDERLLA